MNKHRFTAAVPKPAPAHARPVGALLGSWNRFWFTPVDPIGLHHIRVLAGLLCLAWLLPLAGQHQALFGLNGWFDRQAYVEMAHLPGGPPHPLHWSILYALGSSPVLLTAVYWLSVLVLLLFTLGFCPRLLAVLTWVIVVSFTAPPATRTAGDSLLGLFTFYLMVGYVLTGQRTRSQAPGCRLLGTSQPWRLGGSPDGRSATQSLGANLALRLLQVHFAILILLAGLQKLQVSDWWAGVALWYGWQPPFEINAANLQQLAPHAGAYLTALSVLAYAMLAWQIGFPMFAWRPGWRVVLVGGAVIGWIGGAVLGQPPVLGPALVFGCLAYLTPDEWHQLDRLSTRLRSVRKPPVPTATGLEHQTNVVALARRSTP